MKITERQGEILNRTVQDYIDLAYPVSSEFLEEKHHFGISPATIRIEMQKLTDGGYLYQPHTSAGRVPTDKGYRFFVDDLFQREFLRKDLDFKIEDWIEKEISDTIRCLQSVTKTLASISSNLVLGYLFDKKILWQEGWPEIMKEPEFREKKFIYDFAEMVRSFEKEIENLEINSNIKVYIGRENPFPKAEEFSTILTRCHFPKKEGGILAILGPKRMEYDKNISFLNSLIKFLEKV